MDEVLLIVCVARYNRWMKYVRLAPWNSYETVGFDTPKGHAVLHFLPFVFLFGAVDNARLDNFEHDHQIWVKSAVRRTQMRYATMMEQLEDAVDRVDAVRGMRSLERSQYIGIYIKCLWYLYQYFWVCHVCHLTDAILGPVLRQKRRQPDSHLMCNELLGFVVPIPSKKLSKSDIDGAQFRTFRRLGCLLKTRQGR